MCPGLEVSKRFELDIWKNLELVSYLSLWFVVLDNRFDDKWDKDSDILWEIVNVFLLGRHKPIKNGVPIWSSSFSLKPYTAQRPFNLVTRIILDAFWAYETYFWLYSSSLASFVFFSLACHWFLLRFLMDSELKSREARRAACGSVELVEKE